MPTFIDFAAAGGYKVRKAAKIRNRYNQVPHLTKSDKNTIKHHKQEQRGQGSNAQTLKHDKHKTTIFKRSTALERSVKIYYCMV